MFDTKTVKTVRDFIANLVVNPALLEAAAQPEFNLTGPNDNSRGNMGPSSNPIYPQGTIRLVGNGEDRRIQFDLTIDLKEGQPDWVYQPPIDKFIAFNVKSEVGEQLIPTQYIRGPVKQTELTQDTALFLVHQYGLNSLSFPASLAPGIEQKRLNVSWAIHPDVGTGQLSLMLLIEGNDHGIIESITWSA